jgi:hypothetical protein
MYVKKLYITCCPKFILMGIFNRMSNGWELAMSSLKVLNANKQLIIFPVLSGLAVLLVGASIGLAIFSGADWNTDNIRLDRTTVYLILFVFYFVNYFVVIFFNMALIHCTKLYFDGEEVSVAKGLQFSMSRVHIIFSWVLFSATVGIVLRIIQDNLGWIGKIVTGAIGLVWSIATFLVVPILAYEKLGPLDAVKRSAQLMKEKWGEGIGASFSFGLIFLFLFFGWGIFSYAMSYYINDGAGIAFFVLGIVFTFIISSALHSIFISALYNNINGNINEHFRQQMLDGLFQGKE